MTEAQFRNWPYLLFRRQVLEASGYGIDALRKIVDCGLLKVVCPEGTVHHRFQKLQVAQMVGLSITTDLERFKLEPFLMREKAVTTWTGYSSGALRNISKAGGLHALRLPGLDNATYQKREIAQLLGFVHFL